MFVGCGGAVFQGDDDSGGQGAIGGGGSSGKGGSSGSGGNAGKGSGGSSGSAGSGNGGSGASGGTSGGGGSGGGDVGGTAGMASAGSSGSGGSGNTGNEGGSGSGGGGNGSTEQWAEDYDQGCEFDNDCSLVQQGDKCACPTCDMGAVNHGVVEQYQSDWAAIMCRMGEHELCPANACAEQLASCTESGKCYARVPTYIDGAKYPKMCQQPSDCHFIYTGEVCSSCKCGTAAVNHEGYDQYMEEIAGIDCTPSQNVCDCAAPEQVTCLLDVNSMMGECVMGDVVPVSE